MLLPWKVVDMSPNTVLPHWVRPVNLQLHTLSPDLIARLSNHSTAPSGAAFRRTTTKITIHAMATSKRQPPTNMAIQLPVRDSPSAQSRRAYSLFFAPAHRSSHGTHVAAKASWSMSPASQIAVATFRAACERWPGTPITLRQGARVIEDSRRLRMAWSDKGREGGR